VGGKKDKFSAVIWNSVFSGELRVKLCYFQTHSIQMRKTAVGAKVKSDHCSNTVFWNVLFRLKIPTALRIQYSSRETCQDESVLSSSQEESCGNHIIHKLPGWVTRTGYRRQMTLYLSAFYGKVAFCSPFSHVVCGWRLPPWYLCDTCKFFSFIDSIPRAFTIVTPHKVTLCGVTRE